jgi:hypothetical protein
MKTYKRFRIKALEFPEKTFDMNKKTIVFSKSTISEQELKQNLTLAEPYLSWI